MKLLSILFGALAIFFLAATWFQTTDKMFAASLLAGLVCTVMFMRLQRAMCGSIPQAKQTCVTTFLNQTNGGCR